MYKEKQVTFISSAPENDEALIKKLLKKRPFAFIPVANVRKLIAEDFLTEAIYPYTMIIYKQHRIKKILPGGTDDAEKTFKRRMLSIDNICLKKGKAATPNEKGLVAIQHSALLPV